MSEKLEMFIRGEKFLQALYEIEREPENDFIDMAVKTVDNLDTQKRQHLAPYVTIKNLKFTPDFQNKELIVEATAKHDGPDHDVKIVFTNCEMSKDVPEDDTNFSPVILGGKTIYIKKIDFNNHGKIRCDCEDFRFRFYKYCDRDRNLAPGKPFPVYISKGMRPSVNPAKVAGMCKHIYGLGFHLKDLGLVQTPPDLKT